MPVAGPALIVIEQHRPRLSTNSIAIGHRVRGHSGGPLVDAPGFLRFNAAHQAVTRASSKIEAFAQHHLQCGVIEVAMPAHHVDDFSGVFLRRLVVDGRQCRQRRLVKPSTAHGVHNQIGQIAPGARRVVTFAANGEVDKRLITPRNISPPA